MPLREDIKKVLVIGSGPIQIGQAAEFDFSGSQACLALREEGVKVVLVNSNPATIMTDFEMADVIYIEPLVADVVEKIVEKERPDGVIAGLGGQTALNLVVELEERGVLEKYGVKVLGTPVEAIYNAEDRERFKELMSRIGEPVPRSEAVNSVEEAIEVASELGFPLVIRPAYTLGGFGGGIARDERELREIVQRGLNASRIHQVLVEQSVLGWKEIEYEVMRDAKDTCITVCNMENLDPMGIHTGESIVVAPSQTLTDEEHQMLRSAALKIIRALKVEGGCNIQFALKDGKYYVIEVNPRVSRSSALASKATGYPIARVAAKIALGLTLDEIENRVTRKTPASFEPAIDYVVVKIPRWPFDKFPEADRTLTTSMKSTGEVMAIGRTFEEALQKAIRSLDIDRELGDDDFARKSHDEILRLIEWPNDERIFAIYEALRRGISANEISKRSGIDIFFIKKIENIVRTEEELRRLRERYFDSEKERSECEKERSEWLKQLKRLRQFREILRKAKRMGFSDERIARILGIKEGDVRELRREFRIVPTYKMVDTCAAEFEASTPYYYSTYEEECELKPSKRKKVLIIGAGPIRIGQGIEFDYCTVHAVKALKEEGIETHIINNNPETVSTDFDTSDKLFFEPITLEDVMNVIEKENYDGVMVQFGGQTSVNLAVPLKNAIERARSRAHAHGCENGESGESGKSGESGIIKTEILGTPPERIDEAEDRERFSKFLHALGIPQPESGYATSFEEAKEVARRIGYPVLVRPSYVLGGRAMEIVHDESELERYMREAVRISKDKPVLIDKFLENAVEIDVDAVCDGEDVLIGAIMEHIEQAGIHSGDSACVIPPQSLSEDVLNTIREYVRRIALELRICGLMNVQLAVKDGVVYVLEVNPRASRTVPYVSKATGIPLAKIAAKVMIGKKLKELGVKEREYFSHFAVKEVVLPFTKLPNASAFLGPEMKSTGEVMGIASSFEEAFFKAQLAAENPLPLPDKKKRPNVFISVCDADKESAVEVATKLQKAGMNIFATEGTARFLRERGIKARILGKLHDDSPVNVINMLLRREIHLVINTVEDKYAYKDAHIIRRACVDFCIPYITTMNAANAAADAILRMKERCDLIEGGLPIEVKSLNEYLQC